MKCFTKVLLLIACVAEINVMAQGPSEKCLAGINNIENSSEGKFFKKCEKLSKAQDFKGFCAECQNMKLPSALVASCTGSDAIYVDLWKKSFEQLNAQLKNICDGKIPIPNVKNPTTTKIIEVQIKTTETTKAAQTTTTTKAAQTTTTKTTQVAAETTQATSSSSQASSNTQASSNDQATNGATGATGAAGAAGATGATGATGAADGNTSLNNIITGNNTLPNGAANNTAPNNTTTNQNQVSGASKLSYSLVAALAVAAYNLLL